MEFPEVLPVARGAWGTFIPGRRPEFKAHTNSGHAKNALRQHWTQYDRAIWESDGPRSLKPGGTFTQDMAVYELAQKGEGTVWRLKTVIRKNTGDLDYPEIWPNAS